MSNIMIFPNGSASSSSSVDDCPITRMILEELSYISSDKLMISCIIKRMKPFISTLDFDMGVDIEITGLSDDDIKKVIPPIQALQQRFDQVIAEIISERILHEIKLYHLERNFIK